MTRATVVQDAPLRQGVGAPGFRRRALLFAGLLSWIVGGPFYRQVLGGENELFQPWAMFAPTALDAVDVTFYEQRADGSRAEIDWYAVIHPRGPSHARQRRIQGKDATWAVAQLLCQKLGPATDVRARSRRATRAGWQTDYVGEKDLCRAPPPMDDRPDSWQGSRE